jgi:hypothetical protein
MAAPQPQLPRALPRAGTGAAAADAAQLWPAGALAALIILAGVAVSLVRLSRERR